MGYSHMRDDDPTNLNDDYVQTFIVSSSGRDKPADLFETIVRRHGPITRYLFHVNEQVGEASCVQKVHRPYVVGDIGITLLLEHLPELDISQLR